MNIKNLTVFVEELGHQMTVNSEEGFNQFKSKWSNFDDDERNVLRTILAALATENIMTAEISLETKMYWLAIVNHTEKPVVNGEVLEDNLFPRLELNEGVNGNQITKIFLDLKKAGHIISDFPLIAEAISIIFPIEISTAYKDLTEAKRQIKIKKLLF